jgi:radical SAM superfamily enzyme YgiQ (UPF0313 family)
MPKTPSDRKKSRRFSYVSSKTGRAQLSVALVYPSSYAVGMDNLGFQGIYGLMRSDPRVHCERAFFEKDSGSLSFESKPRSFESGLLLNSFDVVAFSVSFENDYVNVLRILKNSGIEPFASKRDEGSPLLLAGGVGVFMNPEPISPFMDAVFLGEADEAIAEMLDVLVQTRTDGKRSVIESLSNVDGMYVPSKHSPYLGEPGTQVPSQNVKRRYVSELSSTFRSSVISSSRSHLGGMFLVESARGCSRKCRFCAVTSVYAPLRFVPTESLLARIEEGAPARGTVGIVGACVSEYPRLSELVAILVRNGLRVSLSSIRADSTSAELMELIAKSGTRTITTAPEAGTARLRRVINKELEEARLMEMAEAARESGIVSLRLYFMIGLPEERPEDIEAIVSLVGAIRSKFLFGKKAGRVGQVVVSISPFVPKAFTPFQWCRMLEEDSLRKRMRSLAKGFAKMKGVRFSGQSVRSSILEGALSRGSWKTAQALYGVVYEDLNPRRAWSKAGLCLEAEVFEKRDTRAQLPWEHLLVGPTRKELEEELKMALQEG